MKRLLAIIFFQFMLSGLYAQPEQAINNDDLEKLETMEDTLALLAYAVINDSLPEHRFGTCRELILKLVGALKVKNSFHYPFERLRSVSIQYPEDSTFRIFTWQLYVDIDDYRYFGAIQINSPELKLFPLIDRSFNVVEPEQEVLSPDEWYGAVYYKLKEVEAPRGKYYLLFGFDGYTFFQKRKVIDVLHFVDEEPVFGAPVFIQQEPGKPVIKKNRLLIEYSASSSVRMNYDELLEIIIFDHLVEMEGQYGQGTVKYPDGSYEGYKLENGYWTYITKVFDGVLDEAPRPNPILDQRSKDIFGKNR